MRDVAKLAQPVDRLQRQLRRFFGIDRHALCRARCLRAAVKADAFFKLGVFRRQHGPAMFDPRSVGHAFVQARLARTIQPAHRPAAIIGFEIEIGNRGGDPVNGGHSDPG